LDLRARLSPVCRVGSAGALFFYAPDRRGERPEQHLAGNAGPMQADHANRRESRIVKAARWAHGRRKFSDLARLNKAPIAVEAVKCIGVLSAFRTN
jgi:transposase